MPAGEWPPGGQCTPGAQGGGALDAEAAESPLHAELKRHKQGWHCARFFQDMDAKAAQTVPVAAGSSSNGTRCGGTPLTAAC